MNQKIIKICEEKFIYLNYSQKLLLAEIINDDDMIWTSENNIVGEPGFATWRFVKDLSQEVKSQNKSKKKISIKIPNEVRALDLKSINLN